MTWCGRCRPELAARAVLLPNAPSDIVTANRALVSEGDRVIPLSGIWRDERFPDPGEQAKLQALSDAIDDAAGLQRRRPRGPSRTRTAPKGVPAQSWTPSSGRCCGPCSAPTSTACRAGSRRCRGTTTTPSSTRCTWPGPVRLEPGAPHYYRVQGPQLLLEWDNTQRGANHAHSVWRDPDADFGLDVLRGTAPRTTDRQGAQTDSTVDERPRR